MHFLFGVEHASLGALVTLHVTKWRKREKGVRSHGILVGDLDIDPGV